MKLNQIIYFFTDTNILAYYIALKLPIKNLIHYYLQNLLLIRVFFRFLSSYSEIKTHRTKSVNIYIQKPGSRQILLPLSLQRDKYHQFLRFCATLIPIRHIHRVRDI